MKKFLKSSSELDLSDVIRILFLTISVILGVLNIKYITENYGLLALPIVALLGGILAFDIYCLIEYGFIIWE